MINLSFVIRNSHSANTNAGQVQANLTFLNVIAGLPSLSYCSRFFLLPGYATAEGNDVMIKETKGHLALVGNRKMNKTKLRRRKRGKKSLKLSSTPYRHSLDSD